MSANRRNRSDSPSNLSAPWMAATAAAATAAASASAAAAAAAQPPARRPRNVYHMPTSLPDDDCDDARHRQRRTAQNIRQIFGPVGDDGRYLSNCDVTQLHDHEDIVNNYYIYPKEVMNFIAAYHSTLLTPTREEFRLKAFKNIVDGWIHTYLNTLPGRIPMLNNKRRLENPLDFIRNEMLRLYFQDQSADFVPLMTNTVLRIPSHDVRDLPIYLMLYIMYRLSEFASKRVASSRKGRIATFYVGYQISDIPIDANTNITMVKRGDDPNKIVIATNGNIRLSYI